MGKRIDKDGNSYSYGWNHEGVFSEKPCAECGKIFKPRSGAGKYCSGGCGNLGASRLERNPYQGLSGNWSRYFTRICRAKSKRKHLMADQLIKILEDQGGLCKLSGRKLTCNLALGEVCLTNASIDRIKAGGRLLN